MLSPSQGSCCVGNTVLSEDHKSPDKPVALPALEGLAQKLEYVNYQFQSSALSALKWAVEVYMVGFFEERTYVPSILNKSLSCQKTCSWLGIFMANAYPLQMPLNCQITIPVCREGEYTEDRCPIDSSPRWSPWWWSGMPMQTTTPLLCQVIEVC